MQSSRKDRILGPQFKGAGYPNFGHALSNRTHFQTCGRFWFKFRSVSSLGIADEKNKEEEERIAVKPKSADDYIGRPK